jgi:REP element-mobilizing transposase RayT
MLIQDYQPPELRFAYCYHAYLRWSTYRRQPRDALAGLDQKILAELAAPHGIHILQCNCSPKDVRLMVSLKPDESISTCTSKLKGRISRWLREALRLDQPVNLVSKGYFACTSGKSTSAEVDKYLDQQGDHHGYMGRVLPPVYVKAYAPGPNEEALVKANHAFANVRFHLVMATWRRHGVFAAAAAEAVARQWLELQPAFRFALLKVAFVPDHVHIAVCPHPGVAPAVLVTELMNNAQRFMFEQFPEEMIGAKVERLWQPSAYVGSYGDLASPQIQAYVRNWEADSPP